MSRDFHRQLDAPPHTTSDHSAGEDCLFSERYRRGQMPQVTFYFDLGSPYAYLTAERLVPLLREPVDWQPLSLGALFKLTGRSSWALADRRRRQAGMAEIERRAREYELPPIHWPDPWPTNYLMAMRAATFAFAAGRGREFTLRAFRDAFQLGRDLSVPAYVLDAAQRAGLERHEVEAAMQDSQIKQALREATDAAHKLGVIGVPTIAIDGEPFWGDDRLEDAVAHYGGLPADGR
jgi:2-hydroxychromene-2-carboxylate isomerase